MAVEKRVAGNATQTAILTYNYVLGHSIEIHRECDIRVKMRNTETYADIIPRLEFLNQFFANSIIRGYSIRIDLAVFNYSEGPYRYD